MPAKAAASRFSPTARISKPSVVRAITAQVATAAIRPSTKPQCRRSPGTMRGSRASGTSAGDCGQPSDSGSFSGPSSSIETKSSMMKLKSSVVTTSSTPKRTFSTAGPSSTSAPASIAASAISGRSSGAGSGSGAGAEQHR